MDPDQTAPLGAVWSESTLFAYMQNVSLKSLQEDAADDTSRRHFQMQIFLALQGLIEKYEKYVATPNTYYYDFDFVVAVWGISVAKF